jgi:hypothetical protein
MPWRWALEPGDRRAEDGGVGEVLAGDPQEQEIVGGEEPVDPGIAGQVVVERDPAQRQPGGGIGEEEVEPQAVGAPKQRLAAAFGADLEEVGEADLAVDGAGGYEEGGEGVEAGKLIVWNPGSVHGALLPEQHAAADGEQGRAEEEEDDVFHASGHSPEVKDQNRYVIVRGG